MLPFSRHSDSSTMRLYIRYYLIIFATLSYHYFMHLSTVLRYFFEIGWKTPFFLPPQRFCPQKRGQVRAYCPLYFTAN